MNLPHPQHFIPRPTPNSLARSLAALLALAVAHPVAAAAEPQRQPSATSLAELKAGLAELDRRAHAALNRIQALARQQDDSHHALDPFRPINVANLEDLKKARLEAMAHLAILRRQANTPDLADKSEEELAKTKRELTAERDRLQKILRERNPGIVPERLAEGRDRLVIELSEGGIVVPDSPYYRVVEAGYILRDGKRIGAQRVRRIMKGQTIQAALAADGLIGKALGRHRNPSSDVYLGVHVADDSISEYHELYRELRKRNIPHSWTPISSDKERIFLETTDPARNQDRIK